MIQGNDPRVCSRNTTVTQVGRVRGLLRELGRSMDTMLWLTSDNGPEGVTAPSLGSDSSPGSTAGLRGRKRDVWEVSQTSI